MYFGWIMFIGSLTTFLSYFLWKETRTAGVATMASSLSVAMKALKGIARECTCPSFHSRKAYKGTVGCWVGRSYLQICFYFAVFSDITKWKHVVKVLPTPRCPLFWYCFPPIGKAKTSTPCRARSSSCELRNVAMWGGAGGGAGPQPPPPFCEK